MEQELLRGDLPVHPRTGLTAVGIVAGRPVWPILGGDSNAERSASEALEAFDAETQTMRSQLLELGERGDLDEAQTTRFNELDTAFTAREEQRAPLASRVERMARIREQFEANEGVEGSDETENTSRSDNGNGGTTTRSSASNSGAGRGRQTRRTVNPFEGYQTSRTMPVGDVVTRARRSLEQLPDWQLTDAQRSRVDRDLTADRNGILARHIMAGQNPDYVSAFEKIAAGDLYMAGLTDAERSAVAFTDEIKRGITEGSGAAGGFLVPPYFDPTVIHTFEDSVNPLRQLCDQRTINGPKYTAPTMGNVSAGYVGETVEINESVPAFGKFEVDVVKAGTYLKASTESYEDSNVGAEMPGLLQESKDEWEAHEQLLGDGLPGHVMGILTALVAADAAAPAGKKLIAQTSVAGKYTADDLYAMIGAVPPRYRMQFKWLAEYNFYLRARQLAQNNNLGAFWTDLNGDNPPQIAGKPTYEASQMPSAIVNTNYTAGSNIAIGGDFKSAYLIVDRRGMTIKFDALVKGPNGRPTDEIAWYATWRTGGGLRLPRALRALQSS